MSESPSSSAPPPPRDPAQPATNIRDAIAPRAVRFGEELCVLRPLQPADAPRLQEFFYTHTLETIQLRYGHVVARMTDERAFELVNVDQSRDLALGIFALANGREIIHAVGRYYLDPDGRGAEAAFVVRESQRRRGMATLLLQTMLHIARSRGLEHLWGRVRRDNLPMLDVFRRCGGSPVASRHAADPDVEMRVPVGPVATEKLPRTTRTRSTSGRSHR